MKIKLSLIFVLLFLCSCTSGSQESVESEKYVEDYKYLVEVMEDYYPYIEYLEDTEDFDFRKVSERCLEQVKRCTTDLAFEKAIEGYLEEFNNEHTHLVPEYLGQQSHVITK